MNEKYGEMTDEELVRLSQSGQNDAQDALLIRYMAFVRKKAHSYFLAGADREDVVQEGMLGLYKAIRDYKPEKLTSFRTFAEICMTRHIISAIKTATRQKHIPLNSYISLNKPVYNQEYGRTLIDVLSSETTANPEDLVIDSENIRHLEGRIEKEFTALEKKVFYRYLEGKSYAEISADTGFHLKSIDNTLQRVKRKLLKMLAEKQ
ncbi:MAG: RNA polymerase sporulation sigma factor SigH [Christensenellales bacterium]